MLKIYNKKTGKFIADTPKNRKRLGLKVVDNRPKFMNVLTGKMVPDTERNRARVEKRLESIKLKKRVEAGKVMSQLPVAPLFSEMKTRIGDIRDSYERWVTDSRPRVPGDIRFENPQITVRKAKDIINRVFGGEMVNVPPGSFNLEDIIFRLLVRDPRTAGARITLRRGDKLLPINSKNQAIMFRNSDRSKLSSVVSRVLQTGEIADYENYDNIGIFEGSDQPLKIWKARSTTDRTDNEGGFFKHLLDSKFPICLERYGIFKTYDGKTYDISSGRCLMQTLRCADIEDSKLEDIMNRCQSGYVPQRFLKEIAKICSIYITLRKSGSSNPIRYGNKNDRHVNIGCVDNHFFIDELTTMSKCSVVNYQTMDFTDRRYLITRVKRGKIAFDKSVKPITSFELVKQLFLIDGALKPIDVESLMSIGVSNFNDQDLILRDLQSNNFRAMGDPTHGKFKTISHIEDNISPVWVFDTETAQNDQMLTRLIMCYKNIISPDEVKTGSFIELIDDIDAHIPQHYMEMKLPADGQAEIHIRDRDMGNSVEDMYTGELVYYNSKLPRIATLYAHNIGFDFRVIVDQIDAYNSSLQKTLDVYDKVKTLVEVKKGRNLDNQVSGVNRDWMKLIPGAPKDETSDVYRIGDATFTEDDYNQVKNGFIRIEQYLGSSSKTLTCSIKIDDLEINLLCSYQLLKVSLGQFNQSGLTEQFAKDVCPYSMLTDENWDIDYLPLDDARRSLADELKSQAENDYVFKTFYSNCERLNIIKDDKFSLVQYVTYYCKMDIKTLCEGLLKFNEWVKSINGTVEDVSGNIGTICMTNSLSIANLASKFYTQCGSYEGCYQVNGITREYLTKFAAGGKCMTNSNEHWKVTKADNELHEIVEREVKDAKTSEVRTVRSHTLNIKSEIGDLDSVSNYTSAQVELCDKYGGILKGIPVPIPVDVIECDIGIAEQLASISKFEVNPELAFTNDKVSVRDESLREFKTCSLNDVTGYFVSVLITKVGRKLDFPVLNYLTDDGSRCFSNDMVGKIAYLDEIGLRDAIEHQKIEGKIIKGLYYNSGRNPVLGVANKAMFSKRRALKKIGCNSQIVYKFILNAGGYGTHLLKPHKTSTVIMKKKEAYNKLYKGFENIMGVDRVGDNTYLVETVKPILDHFNSVHIGVNILSQSKSIMSRVLVIAQELGIKVFYTDTDSLMLSKNDVRAISERYEIKYGVKLLGKDLSQFHCDIDDFLGYFKIENSRATDVIVKKLTKMGIEHTRHGCEIDLPVTRMVDVKNLLKKHTGIIVDSGTREARCTAGTFVWKKMYSMELEATRADGSITGHTIAKLKGISQRAIEWKHKQRGDSKMDMYNDLFNLKRVEFDLINNGLDGGKMSIEYGRDMSIKQRVKLTREVGIISATEIMV